MDLVLSGHTHGGQVAVPHLPGLNFLRLRRKPGYVAGLYRRGDSTLYVHSGLGTTGPPLRLGVAPEIAVIELTPAA